MNAGGMTRARVVLGVFLVFMLVAPLCCPSSMSPC